MSQSVMESGPIHKHAVMVQW